MKLKDAYPQIQELIPVLFDSNEKAERFKNSSRMKALCEEWIGDADIVNFHVKDNIEILTRYYDDDKKQVFYNLFHLFVVGNAWQINNEIVTMHLY